MRCANGFSTTFREGTTSSPSVKQAPPPLRAHAGCRRRLALLLAAPLPLPRLSQRCGGQLLRGTDGILAGPAGRLPSIKELSQLVGFPVEEVEEVPFSVTEISTPPAVEPWRKFSMRGRQSLTFRKTAEGRDPSRTIPPIDTLVLELQQGHRHPEGGRRGRTAWPSGRKASYVLLSPPQPTRRRWTAFTGHWLNPLKRYARAQNQRVPRAVRVCGWAAQSDERLN